MANLEQIVSQKAEKDARWKEQQQVERENTVALSYLSAPLHART